MTSPLDPVDQILNVLSFVGGFSLSQDRDGNMPPAFHWKQSVCKILWGFIMNFILYFVPIGVCLAICYSSGYQGLNVLFPYLDSASSAWRLSGLTTSCLVTHYVCVLFELLCAVYNLILMAQMADALSELCEEMGSILQTSVSHDQISSVTSSARWRHLGWFCMSFVIFPFNFYVVYARFPTSLNDGIRIAAAMAAAGGSVFFIFALPSVSAYLMIDQCLGTLIVMLKNYSTQLIPPSRNGRLVRTAPGNFQPANPLLSDQYNKKPIQGQYQQSGPNSNKSLPSGPTAMIANMVVVSDAETVIGYGNAFASMVEKSEDAFGNIIWLESLMCFVMSVIHFYLFTPISNVSNLWQPDQLAFLVCFCISNLLSGICFQLRMSTLAGLGQRLSDGVLEARQNLREFTILKMMKLNSADLSEIGELRERFGDVKNFKPAGYFKMNRSTLLVSRVFIVTFVLLLMTLH